MIPAEEHLRAIRDELEQEQALAAPSAFEAAALIQLDKVSLSFERPVLQDVSMVAREGETLMVVGESGSGKSTILKLILRLLVPDAGTIRVFGHDIGHMSFQEALEMRRQIGMVFQTAALFDSLTIYENVAYPLRENADLDED
jgi:phospholipid/cholesterol/gamma-HCH transport system ATP-binding protein